MSTKHHLFKVFSIIAILAMTFSNIQPVTAQGSGGDGLKRQVNAESGKVSFIVPESGRALSAVRALGTSIRPQNLAMALAKRFAPEFGVKNPERDLAEMKDNRGKDGRQTVRYQQKYQGIPVMGGELIVDTNDRGDLYSMSGEVSPNLSVNTQPKIDAKQAQATALQSVAKWYQKKADDFQASEPALWIYDESLLQPSTRPVELVWRMDVTAKDNATPVRELVLVNAQRGSISLHFNQMDTAWSNSENTPITKFNTNRYTLTIPGVWYVATTGNDSNDCATTLTPCVTINGAINKAADSDVIEVAIGTYRAPSGTEVVLINKGITLSGGWSVDFSTQISRSTIDGQSMRTGIRITFSEAIVDHFIIQNGYNESGGGGIRIDGGLALNNSIVSDNVSHLMGGGILNDGTLTTNNTTINNNTVGQINYGGEGGGGGIYSQGTATLNNTTINGNIVLGQFYGSGINNSGNLILNNSTISGNTGSAGISNSYGTITLNNSTITKNVGPYIGGIQNIYSEVILQNSIVANNKGTTAPDCNKATSSGNNLIGINTYTFVDDLSGEVITDSCLAPTVGDLVGTTANPVNPWLNLLQDNGGPTLTHALMVGSPAIDAGNPATCLSTDQRGVARPVGSQCDIGAFEGSVPWARSPLVSTYTTNNSSYVPGTFLCDQTDPTCAAGDADAKAAHKYAIGTYNFYATRFSRDSIDNNGMTITSTVHYCDPDFSCPYDNAYWDGTQMIYGDAHGYTFADDVVAHELTHGVTQYESNLVYYYQSGAINESLSDVFGEYYDQTNGLGNDAANVKWLLGEDVTGLGALRSMSNPPAYGDPDKMTSTNYYKTAGDNGGVHHNSGVNNKAAFLMVDGGTFNGKTVSSLGWEKVGALYYEVNTNLLTSGADYSDLYYAMQQACVNLIGQHGITAADCAQVKNALDAVQMNAQPVANFNADAPLCDAGKSPVMNFADDLENGAGNWTFNTVSSYSYTRWQYDSPWGQYAQSGNHFLYADDYYDPDTAPQVPTDATAQLTPRLIPAGAYLWFAHAYDFEQYTTHNYDGGVLEYSTNGGSTWTDAKSLINSNGYNGKVATGYSNPLANRNAFVGSSHGYISTRVNLSSLSGKTVAFRWRMGLDIVGFSWGWWVDNVKLYTCTTARTISGNAGSANALVSYMDSGMKTVMADASGNYTFTVPNGWSGSVLPYKTGYSFNPAKRTYTNLASNQTLQNYTAGACVSCANINVSINGTKYRSYMLPGGGAFSDNYTSVLSGPVKVTSTDGSPIFTSQRVTSGDSYNELLGMPFNQFTTEYWFPYYDHGYPSVGGSNMRTWILVGNPSASQSAYVNIYIGGNLMSGSPFSIAPGANITPRWIGTQGGPVRLVSNIPVFASERVFTSNNNAFNESLGIASNDFASEYWFPWYDNVNMQTSVVVGNTSSSDTAKVDIYIGANKQGSYDILPNTTLFESYPSLVDGPVRVVSTNGVNIVTSLNSVSGPNHSFSDVMGYPFNQFTTEYWFPNYDHGYPSVSGSNMRTWILVGNPSSSQTANVNIYIGGVLQTDPNNPSSTTFSIGPGSRVTPRWVGKQGGPVRVVSDIPVFASERVFTTPSSVFNEMLGYPASQLTSEYWYPWYDGVNMTNDILVGKP